MLLPIICGMTHCVLIPDETVIDMLSGIAFGGKHDTVQHPTHVRSALWRSFASVNFVNVRLNRSGLGDQRYRFTVNDTDTTGTVSPLPVPVSYRFVLTVCNPTCQGVHSKGVVHRHRMLCHQTFSD